MKTLSYPLFVTVLIVAIFMAAEGQTPAPLAIPAPAVTPAATADSPSIAPGPGGTSVAGAIGLTVYNNAIYLVRDTGVTLLDASTIPAGHMMTLDGRITPLPAGTKFPQAAAPKPGTPP